MATFIENENLYPTGIYSLATSDPVKGGALSGSLDAPTDGHANAQGLALAYRTAYLNKRMNPIGEVIMYAGSTAPYGYLVCNGAAVSRSTYATLFALCGTSFGQGNGTTTFNLPDLRGRFVRMTDGGSGLDPDAAGRTAMATGGATGNNIGSVQADAFEAHTHTVKFTPQGANPETFDEAIIGDGNGFPASVNATLTGGNETRPVNAYLNFIIKAYN
jgi:microcystin-dependent protein